MVSGLAFAIVRTMWATWPRSLGREQFRALSCSLPFRRHEFDAPQQARRQPRRAVLRPPTPACSFPYPVC